MQVVGCCELVSRTDKLCSTRSAPSPGSDVLPSPLHDVPWDLVEVITDVPPRAGHLTAALPPFNHLKV